MATQLAFDYGTKPASLYEMPYPVLEYVADDQGPTGFYFHSCGFKHLWACENPERCIRPYKTVCVECAAKVEASYRAGVYAR